ncbi:hypothetical protein AJ87_05350 [Rhizobium yanglingense]|nr:hypothetical protein AJ87_05350 [Rhizobium yanglingense]
MNPALIDETSAIEFDQSPHLAKPQPKLLVAAPLSGHFATLPRVTVETFSHRSILHRRLARRAPGAAFAGRVDLKITSTVSSPCCGRSWQMPHALPQASHNLYDRIACDAFVAVRY